MGSSSGGDTGGVDTVDTGASSGGDLGARRRRATLGPVVTRSEGIDGGCVCTSPGAPAPAHDGAYVVAALGLACAGIWRRRRER
jgi:MYXO-CTERM domain-containing protein